MVTQVSRSGEKGAGSPLLLSADQVADAAADGLGIAEELEPEAEGFPEEADCTHVIIQVRAVVDPEEIHIHRGRGQEVRGRAEADRNPIPVELRAEDIAEQPVILAAATCGQAQCALVGQAEVD